MIQNHIIQRQVLELLFHDRARALSLQNDMSAVYRDKIISHLEMIFNKLVSSHEHIRIQKLEIDLGKIPVSKLEEEFCIRAKSLTEEKLSSLVSRLKMNTSEAKLGRSASGSLNECNTIWIDKENSTDGFSGEITFRSEASSKTDRLVTYLRSGQNQWQVKGSQSLELLMDGLMNNHPATFRELILLEARDPQVVKRLVYQFSENQISKILELLDQVVYTYYKEICAFILHQENYSVFSVPASMLLQQIRIETLQCLASGREMDKEEYFLLVMETVIQQEYLSAKSSGSFIEQVLFFYKEKLASLNEFPTVGIAVKEILKRLLYREQPDTSILEIEKVMAGYLNGSYASLSELIRALKMKRASGAGLSSATHNLMDGKRNLIEEEKFKGGYEKDFLNEVRDFIGEKKTPQLFPEIYIDNAGLVLLAPFLNRFFINLGLVNEKAFISQEAVMKAVHLLQYIVTEAEGTPEEFLALNKILCGIPVNEPVVKEMTISAHEKEECENLISSVISNWPALKNTSIASFRSRFLNRRGILREDLKGWTLYVERTSLDILMEKLPWSVAIIKLPWKNNEIFYVEW